MPQLPLHPLVVHFPVALAALVPLVSTGLLLASYRRWLPDRAFRIAVALQLALVVSGIVAIRTGEADAERVERVIPEAVVEAHEEAAERFVYAASALALVFVAAAWLGERPLARRVATLATLGSYVVLGFGYSAGHAGGRLVYQHGAASALVATPDVQPAPRADTERD